MINYVDLSSNKQRRLIKLNSKITKDDYIKIGTTYFHIDGDNCYTEFVPSGYDINKVSDEVVNNTVVYNNKVAFNISKYYSIDQATSFIGEGLASIYIENNLPTTFYVDGYKFNLVNYGETTTDAYSINIGSSVESTAYNIASTITAVCPRISATSHGRCVIFRISSSGIGLNGNVCNILGLDINDIPESSVSIKIGDWVFTSSSTVYTPECYIESKLIKFSMGYDYNSFIKNLEEAFNTYYKETGLGFARVSGNTIFFYLCNLHHTISDAGPFNINRTFKTKISNQNILEVDEGDSSIKILELYNVYGNDASISTQIAAGIYANPELREAVNSIKLNNGDSVSVYFNSNSDYPIISYSPIIRCYYNEGISSYAIMDNCISYLYSILNDNEYIEAYYANEDSIKIATLQTEFSSSTNIQIIEIGDSREKFKSSESEPMSIYDFNKFIDNNTNLGTIVLSNSGNTNREISISKNVSLTLTNKVGSYLRLSSTLFKFENCSVDLSIEGLQLDWHSASSSSIFDLTSCQGKVYIVNSETCLRSSGSLISLNSCINFNLYNQNSSYLLSSTTSSVSNVFSINNSAINLLSKYNVVDVPSRYVNGFFYYRSNSSVASLERKDLFSSYSDNFKLDNVLPLQDISVNSEGPYKRIVCGLSNSGKVTNRTFNLTCNSAALNLDYDNKAPNDIFGRRRGLEKAFGNSILEINGSENVLVSDYDYLKINSDLFYIKNGYKKYDSISSIEEMLKVICEVVSYTSEYKINYEKVSSNYNLIVSGTIVNLEFSENLAYLVSNYYTDIVGNLKIDSNTLRYTNCIDFGSRQKNTIYDEVLYVDISSDYNPSSYTRTGTEYDKLTRDDMFELCKSMYPRFGNTTFILKGSKSGDLVNSYKLNEAIVSSSSDNKASFAVMYGNITFKSDMLGIKSVPILKHTGNSVTSPLFTLGCYGSSNIIFENIVLASKYQVFDIPNDTYKTFGIEIRNCILKNYHSSNPVINYNSSHLKAVESTILDSGLSTVSKCIDGSGIFKIEASLVGNSSVPESSEYNLGFYKYNYKINLSSSEGLYLDNGNYIGPNCLVDSSFETFSDSSFSINNFKIDTNKQDNKAIDFIPTAYNLSLTNPTIMFDIGGRYRYNEISKVSLDVGAIETDEGLVEPTTKTYYVSLGNTSDMKYSGNVRFISWEDFKNIIENLDEIKHIYKVHLSGYGIEKSAIHIKDSVSFYEQARIEFYGDTNCVYEGDSFFKADCEFISIAVSGLIIRTKETCFDLKESYLVLTNSFLLSNSTNYDKTFYYFNVGDNSSVNLYSCSILGARNYNIFNEGNYSLSMFGCAVQGYDKNSIFGYTKEINTSVEGYLLWNNLSDLNQSLDCGYTLLNNSLSTKEYLTCYDSKLIQEPDDRFAIYFEDIENPVTNKLLEIGMKYNWISDISGNTRALTMKPSLFDNKQEQKKFYIDNGKLTSYGCFDSKSSHIDEVYSDIPNREITCITELGRTMITRMLSNTVRFRIEGFAICSDGYDFSNPVLASSIRESVRRKRITYKVNDVILSYEDATITIGNITLNKNPDFSGNNKESIVSNLINSINKINSPVLDNLCICSEFSARVEKQPDTFVIERVMPGLSDIELVCSVPNAIEQISIEEPLYDVHYVDNQILPRVGFNKFDNIEYLPLAISMYYRIDRGSWHGGFGSEVVYARVVESDNEEEINMLFPLCVCHHGLITKSQDSFVVGRIVLQI